MICFHTVAKHFPDYDKAEEDGQYDRAVLNPETVQNFVYQFILDKLAVEKIYMSVGANFEKFLNGLERPLKLNEMRSMKEGNYEKFREILSDSKQLGDPVLKIIMEEKDKFFDKDVFDLVYQGFWDLYTFKPAPGELGVKKMIQWITRIQLSVPDDQIEATEEQEAPEPSSLKALVRIRIPLQQPEPELDEDGNPKDEIPPRSEWIEIIPDDKTPVVQTIVNEQRIWVIHQHAQRLIRQEIAKEMRRNIPELSSIDVDDF